MGDNLRDQLRKANLLSEKEAKRLAHEQRIERKEKGRETIEREQQQRAEELRSRREEERERNRAEARVQEAGRKEHEETAACRAILDNEARKPAAGGAQWYFRTEDGDLPWLEVSTLELNQLRSGMLCVVRRKPGVHDYRVLPTELARRVAGRFPEVIAHAPKGVVPRKG